MPAIIILRVREKPQTLGGVKMNKIKTLGKQTEGRDLYIVFWERMANSGVYMIWAENPQDACIYNTEFVKHTTTLIENEGCISVIGEAK